MFQQERVTAIDRLQTRINEQIRISPVRVIGADGQQLGILTTQEAIARAYEVDLDLVEVAPNERPPVCRIMDFGKYKYEKKKKSGQNQHHTKTKEIRLRPKTGEHDVSFKVKQAMGFLKHKDKVQVSVVFRGREMAHVEEGRKVIEEVIELLQEMRQGRDSSPAARAAHDLYDRPEMTGRLQAAEIRRSGVPLLRSAGPRLRRSLARSVAAGR